MKKSIFTLAALFVATFANAQDNNTQALPAAPAVTSPSYLSTILLVIVFIIVAFVVYRFFKSISSSNKKNERQKRIIAAIFCLLLCATGYLLFSSAGGWGSGTMSLWNYWTNDVLWLLSECASDEVASGLMIRKILIWPCLIGDIICIIEYIRINKQDK